MKVILIQDVKALGKKGDVVDVSDGYARNFIIPKKLGREATAKNLNDLKLKNANEEKLAKQAYENALAFAEDIKDKACIVRIKTGEGGRTFGSVSSKEIAAAFKEQFGLEIDKKKLKLDETIKTVGFYPIPVKLHREVTATLKVIVEEKG